MRAASFNSLVCSLVLISVLRGQALTNGLALTPPMGYNSWYLNHANINEGFIRSIADTMATNGLRGAGYEYICLDDGWAYQRDTNGVIMPQPAKFPSGMKALADYVHAKGFKFGIYSVWGPLTCENLPGSCGHVVQDANTYAAWGVDYLKYDACSMCTASDLRTEAELMANALLNCGRPIFFNLSLSEPVADWMPALLNSWRGTGDDYCLYGNVLYHLDVVARSPALAGPGHWNDPDVLEVGRPCLSVDEAKANFGMWCIAAAPLFIMDCNFDPACMDILTNGEAIAVDQDPAGIQGVCVATNGDLQVWCKPLGSDGTVKAVALLNRGETAANITANWTDLNLPPGPAAVRDLWARAYAGDFTNSYTANVPAHGVQLVKIFGAARVPPPPPGTNYLSDLHWLSDTTNPVPILLDQDSAGNSLRLHGTAYLKGLGAQPYSCIQYSLGGAASRFRADVGVDDDVCCSAGSVIFRVWADSVKLYDSGVMTSGSTPQAIDVDVTGKNILALEVTDAGDGSVNDYADWAGARIVVPTLPPAVPVMLAAAAAPNQIALSWYASTGANSYNLKRSTTSNGPFEVIASTNTTAFTDADVVQDAVYYYIVSAVNTFGESADSAPLTSSLPAYWINTVTSTAQNWNENGNWINSSAFPNAAGRAAVINADVLSDQTVNLNQNVTIGSLAIGDANGSAAYTLVANGGVLTFGNGSSPGTLTQLATSKGDTLAVPITVNHDLVVYNCSTNPLTLSGTNVVSGALTVAQGTLKAGNAAALGAATGSATIARGATLDLNGFNLSPVRITVSGPGVNQNGALVNNAGQPPGVLCAVTLSGDTTFGGAGPWDIRSGGVPALSAALNTSGNPYNLTKVGSSRVSLVAANVDPALGDIDVQEGIMSFESTPGSMGNPASTLTVRAGATLSFLDSTNAWKKVIVLNGDGLTPTMSAASGSNSMEGPVTLNGACTFAVADSALMLEGPISGAGSLTKTGDGLLCLAGTNCYAGKTLVAAGTLAIRDPSSIVGSTQIIIASGALLDAGTPDDGGIILAGGQTLSGSGSLNGDCTVGGGAMLAQSDPAGVLTFCGSLTLAAGSTSVLAISKPPGTDNQVRVSGGLAYGGRLVLTNISANSLAVGDSFPLFSAASYTGGFAYIVPLTPGPGLLWDPTGLTRNGTLRVVAGDPPRIGALVLAGNRIFISGAGGSVGTSGRACCLLTSTNPALPLDQWTSIATNELDGAGNFSFSNSIAPGVRSAFYLVQFP